MVRGVNLEKGEGGGGYRGDDDVAEDWFLDAGEEGEDGVVDGVALVALAGPGVLEVEVGAVEGGVDDLVVVGFEAGPVSLEVEGFGGAGEGGGGFEDDEEVDFEVEFEEADFEPVEFGVDEEEVIDFPGVGAVGVDREAVVGAGL